MAMSMEKTLWTAFKIDEDNDSMRDEEHAQGRIWLQGIGPLTEKVELIQASWYGKYGWTTWAQSKEDAIEEAMASRSRGISTTKGLQPTMWLLFSLEIDPVKAYELLIIHRAATPAKERNDLLTWRIMGDIVLKEYKYSKHFMRINPLTHDHWADVQVGKYYKDEGEQACAQCGERHATWAKYCSVCWRNHLHTEEKREKTRRNLIENVKESRMLLNSSVKAIAEHERLDHEGVLNFVAQYIDESDTAMEEY